MAASLDQAHVEKKFRGVTTTQESIQSLSMWVIHHKAQHEKIVDIWFGVLKKSKLDHRLTLFYLCNDIVQMCRRKHAVMYKDAFKEVLKDATLFVRDGTVRPAIERIFKIWAERGIYDEEFTEELVDIINNTKARSTINSKLLAEFQPLVLMEKVITLKRFEDEIELKRRQLVSLRMDASSVEAVRQLKDRTHGGEFCAEFESACTKMEDYVKSLEKEMADRANLIEVLEQSELYYDAQYGEAKIVANAYKNFGGRVSNLQKKLEEKTLSLPDSVSPVPSPPMFDAPSPSPENSPLHEAAAPEDVADPYDSPIPPGVTTPEHLSNAYDMEVQHGAHGMHGTDTQQVDMEMSDDEQEPGRIKHRGRGQYRRLESTHVTPAYPDPISSVTDIHFLETIEDSQHASLSPRSDEEDMAGPQGSPLVVDKDDKNAEYIPSVTPGASSSFLDMMTAAANKDQNKESDGGSTPVMDEFENDSSGSKKKDRSSKDKTKASKQRPIDFLAQLIGQSNNSSDSSSSSSFFKNLSVLTESVKSKMVTEDKSLPPNNTADQWAAWKALQGPPAKLSPPPGTALPPPQPMPPTPPVIPGAPQIPPPPRIHPSLMPMPAPPFPAPLPPPPVLPSQPEPPTNPFPRPPQMDPNFPPPQQNYNHPPPQGGAGGVPFPRPPPGPQENSYPPPLPGSNSYRPPPVPSQGYTPGPPQHDSTNRYVSPPVTTATSPSFPTQPNYQGQTSPPTSYGGPPPHTPTTPTQPPPGYQQQQQPGMYHNPMSSFPRAGNPNNYASPQTFTPQSPFMGPPGVQQGSSGPRFPSTGDQNTPSQQRRDSWASSSNEPPSPKHGVQFPPSSHRSNLTTIKTVDDKDLRGPNHNNTSATNHPPGGQKPQPTCPSTPDRRVGGGRGDEGQMEFIEKLKMKSANQSTNHSSNLRTLTEVPIEQSGHHHYQQAHPAKNNLNQQAIGAGQQQATTNLAQEQVDMEESEEDEPPDTTDEEDDDGGDNDNTEKKHDVPQTVGGFLQQMRLEANKEKGGNNSNNKDGEQSHPQQQHHQQPHESSSPSQHHDYSMDRNNHLQNQRGGFHQQRPMHPAYVPGGGGGGGRDEQDFFGGSRFRMRLPDGMSPRQFSGPRSPFGRPPERGHFGPRQFGGFPNKRPPLGRPYFPRPRY